MANNPANDLNSRLEEGMPFKNTDATPTSLKDTHQSKEDKQPQNTETIDAIREQRDRLKQLEQEAERQ
ncbi:hypothetical protein AHAS_Ahas01G0177400 [Arachis hypogaea]